MGVPCWERKVVVVCSDAAVVLLRGSSNPETSRRQWRWDQSAGGGSVRPPDYFNFTSLHSRELVLNGRHPNG